METQAYWELYLLLYVRGASFGCDLDNVRRREVFLHTKVWAYYISFNKVNLHIHVMLIITGTLRMEARAYWGLAT